MRFVTVRPVTVGNAAQDAAHPLGTQSACAGAVSKSGNLYVIAAAVVWAAIWVATGAVLADNEFDDMIPILGGGTVFFIVLVPAALFRKRP